MLFGGKRGHPSSAKPHFAKLRTKSAIARQHLHLPNGNLCATFLLEFNIFIFYFTIRQDSILLQISRLAGSSSSGLTDDLRFCQSGSFQANKTKQPSSIRRGVSTIPERDTNDDKELKEKVSDGQTSWSEHDAPPMRCFKNTGTFFKISGVCLNYDRLSRDNRYNMSYRQWRLVLLSGGKIDSRSINF